MITFQINGKQVNGEDGWTVLDVAKSSGIDIPTLCHHGALEPFGACRLCIVEVHEGKRRRLVTSCLYPIRQGIEVYTESERVLNVRRWILQMLVDEHPGSEKIRQLARAHGVKASRFVANDLEDTCILCGLCVRACTEIAGVSAITFANRGAQRKLSTTFALPSEECIGCGSCLYVCPTESMERLFDKVRDIQKPLRAAGRSVP